MSPDSSHTAPYAALLIMLLRGVIYNDDPRWNDLLIHQRSIQKYFQQMGLSLVLDEREGFAYLTQPEPEDGEEALPRLMHRHPLSPEASILCVVLRERLDQFDRSNTDNRRCLVSQSEILEDWQLLVGSDTDEVRMNRRFKSALKAVAATGLIRQMKSAENSLEDLYEITRLIKAKINSDKLQEIKDALEELQS
jgi:hypothetical protein